MTRTETATLNCLKLRDTNAHPARLRAAYTELKNARQWEKAHQYRPVFHYTGPVAGLLKALKAAQ